MKILTIGASGTIGSAVVAALAARGHDVVAVSRSTEPSVDLTDPSSIEALFDAVGPVDAVVCAAGGNPFVALPDATPADFAAGFGDKLGGQINLVLSAQHRITDGGSITLITGVLAREPIATGSIATAINGGLEAFVTAAALELPRGIRINAVSPTVITEALDAYGDFFPGFEPVPAAAAATAFVKSVEGIMTGRVFPVG
ncbi:short chain dehydrogenase [Gordonia sp. (in: high G+C Gram-positive bacteria)]|uniref:short chain dehydrogenase n=1 Tax=unclassified Gordonia (in: high G+C Gram-positive bacteria) TaxID=2657482 RepID=UPI002604C98C|nr:short chain dehydrogenase [Gordonia sp. (in: high G+C Gram-positive bacteria)]